jgi:hypothetical protein
MLRQQVVQTHFGFVQKETVAGWRLSLFDSIMLSGYINKEKQFYSIETHAGNTGLIS